MGKTSPPGSRKIWNWRKSYRNQRSVQKENGGGKRSVQRETRANQEVVKRRATKSMPENVRILVKEEIISESEGSSVITAHRWLK